MWVFFTNSEECTKTFIHDNNTNTYTIQKNLNFFPLWQQW